MTYTPRRIVAWLEVMERIDVHDRASEIETIMAGSHPSKELKTTLHKLREQL